MKSTINHSQQVMTSLPMPSWLSIVANEPSPPPYESVVSQTGGDSDPNLSPACPVTVFAFPQVAGPIEEVITDDATPIDWEALQLLTNRVTNSSAPRVLGEEPRNSRISTDLGVSSESKLQLVLQKLYPFQREVFRRCVNRNSILCLPTGAGKTVIAAALAVFYRITQPTKTVVFIVNRIPLVNQQARILRQYGLQVAVVCSDRRDADSWSSLMRLHVDAVVIIDAILRDWIAKSAATLFDDCSLIIFDEIHHARKESNYAKLLQFIPRQLDDAPPPPRVLGLSASPSARGSKIKTRKALEELMGLARSYVVTVIDEVDDLDTRLSIPDTSLIEFEPTNLERVLDRILKNAIESIEQHVIPFIRERGFRNLSFPLESCIGLPYGSPNYVVKAAEAAAAVQQQDISIKSVWYVAKTLELFNQLIIILEECSPTAFLKRLLTDEVMNALEPTAAHDKRFLERVDKKSVEYFDFELRRFLRIQTLSVLVPVLKLRLQKRFDSALQSTKMSVLIRILQRVNDDMALAMPDAAIADRFSDFRGIIFCTTKAATVDITQRLQQTELGAVLKPKYFVGHGRTIVELNDELHSISMNDTQQQRVLQEFREGTTKLLVATSVAEEGLDIPECNIVVRYEGFMTPQSFIQSRGRARKRGSLFFVISKSIASNPILDIMNELNAQDEVIREVALMRTEDQDAIIESAAPAGQKSIFHADPNSYLNQACADHGLSQDLELRSVRAGMEATVVIRLPDGGEIKSVACGSETRAMHEARIIACQKLFEKGYLDPTKPIRKVAVEQAKFQYYASPSIATTRHTHITTDESEKPAFVTTFDESHWGVYERPFSILFRTLRSKGLQKPIVLEPTGEGECEVSVSIYFLMHTSLGVLKWHHVKAQGSDKNVALQNASLVALRALGLNTVVRPHSLLSQ